MLRDQSLIHDIPGRSVTGQKKDFVCGEREDSVMGDERQIHLLRKDTASLYRGIAVLMVVLSHYAEWWIWFVPLHPEWEILHLAVTKLGVYGVDIFFLFSGYAMMKSMNGQTMSLRFIIRRIQGIYIPYLVIIGIIDLLSGGFVTVKDFLFFVSGYEYWFMFVLFVLLGGFIVVCTILNGHESRAVAMVLYTAGFSYILYQRGMQDFWYVSNMAFAVGVAAAAYEGELERMLKKAGIPVLLGLAVSLVPVVWSGLIGYTEKIGALPEEVAWLQIGATLLWSGFVLVIAVMVPVKNRILGFLGKHSLYIYLLHTYVFMRFANLPDIPVAVCFAGSTAVTLGIAVLFRWVMQKNCCVLIKEHLFKKG